MHVLQAIYIRFRQYRIPLTRLTEEKQAFQWTQEVENAFQTLNGAFYSAPISPTPSQE
jgi:hypothetical protein